MAVATKIVFIQNSIADAER